MFYNRIEELNTLKKYLNSDNLEFFILYGRRRVGKTALLKKAVYGKKGIFFVGRQVTGSTLLDAFSNEVARLFNLHGATFKSWEDALRFVFQKAKDENIYLVLDEFQYLVEASPELPSIIQMLVDHEESKIKLILCSSSISFMEKLLAYKSPVFGRKTGYMKLNPVKFEHSHDFLPDYDFHNLMKAYAITGGVPQYLNLFDTKKSISKNIIDLFLSSGAPLKEEPLFILSQELREPKIYQSILEALAFGYNRPGDIASKIGFSDSRKIQPYLHNLITLNIVQKEIPVTIKNPIRTRKGIYVISDPLFRFWYRFVFPYLQYLEFGQIEPVIEQLEKNFEQFVSFQFEKEARIFLSSTLGFDRIGRFWENDLEIDIIGKKRDQWFIGECKWRNRNITQSDLNTLYKKEKALGVKPSCYILVSKTGFKNNLEIMQNIMLVKLDRDKGWIIDKKCVLN